jgi:Fe-S oxidoreductase
MLYARYQRDGLPLRERFFSNVDLLGRIGCTMPGLANAIVDLAPIRAFMEKTLGISAKRSLPHYTRKRFDRWYKKNCRASVPDAAAFHRNALQNRAKVILWDDTFVRYHEPNIGIAAVNVLNALGFEVELLRNRKCCGRPAFSQGNLDVAAEAGRHNVDLVMSSQPLNNASQTPVRLAPQQSTTPIIFLEPSCWSMFVEDYRELKIKNAEKIAARCFLFEKFVDDVLEQNPDALSFKHREANVAIHPHCHAKSLINPAFMARLVERLPGRKAVLLDTGCCGMAGAFGALAEKYELSRQVAADLLRKIDNQQADVVIASGTSCRHQIVDLSSVRPKHMAELLADALA